MKRSILITLLCLLSITAFGQKYEFYQTKNYHNQLRLDTMTGEVAQIQDDGQMWIIALDVEEYGNKSGRFRLYETKNIWNYIELDTFTGRLWQIQFSVEGVDYMLSIPINKVKLANYNYSAFTIQPLVSMYQYYLINQETGAMWKFQWSTDDDDDYRWIERFK